MPFIFFIFIYSISKEDLEIVEHTYDCLHSNKKICNCNKLEYVNTFKYLGLKIDKNFNWNSQVIDICSRLRCVLGTFYHLNKVLNKETLRIVYSALADSILSYGLSVYGRTFITYLGHNQKKCTF